MGSCKVLKSVVFWLVTLWDLAEILVDICENFKSNK
jgi:hypothetical protein